MRIHGPGPGHKITAPSGSPESGFSAQLAVKKWFATVNSVMSLYFGATGGSDIKNDEVILLGNAAAHLKYANIKPDSERVKKRNDALPPDLILFVSPNTWVNLNHDDIVKGSVKVFDEGEDECILSEGLDYEIDYKDGKIKRIQASGTPGSAEGAGAGAGSSISLCPALLTLRQTVVVHYAYYADYSKDVDYHIDYQQGLISRLAQSRISIGDLVFVDYKTETNIDTFAIESAIDQAHTFIMQKISRALEGTLSADLQHAETYLALSYLALASAGDMLEARRSDSVKSAAVTMIQLGQSFEQKGWEFLSPFLRASGSAKSAAKIKKNHSWSNS
jgi:hypothetical protein